MRVFCMPHIHSPSKDEMAALEPLNRLGLSDIVVISTRQQAEQAFQALDAHSVLGFDTESN